MKHILEAFLLRAFLVLLTGCSIAVAGDPPREWIDAKTGHRVVRLSEQAGSVSLYFHQNTYSPEGDKLLISTPRGLETVDLHSYELKVVVPRSDFRMGGSSGVEMGRKTRHVYYAARTREGTVVRATHIDTGETRDLVTLPRGAGFNGVNADETLLFGSIRDFETADRSGDRDRSRSGQRDSERSMKLFTADIATGEINTFHPSKAWLNHLQCSPTDPKFGLFCHEGIWQDVDRVWTITLGSEDAKLMHRRQQQYEIAGHEFFSADGQWVWYDLQTPRADQFWLAGVDVKTGERIRYSLKRQEWSVHYNQSQDGKLFAGDGGGPESVANQTPLPEKRRLNPAGNGQWIYLFRPSDEFTEATVGGEPAKSGTLTAERLVDLSTHDYDLEPNVNFTPDGKWIVFRSNMHGERHVYMVSVERDKGAGDTPALESASLSADTTLVQRRLVLIGDSTVKNGTGRGDDELFGWGQFIDNHFDTNRIEVENRALGGRSSRTYLTEGLWKKSLDRLRKGDYVMMQFGHNDGGKMFDGDRPRASIKGNGDESIDGVVAETGKAETVHSFGWYLRKYIADAKAKGAIPIVLSQVPRDRWQESRVIRSDRDYGLWAKQAAEQTGALFIDLNEIVCRRYEELGEEKVGRELFTPDDWTHTRREGAEINAACVAEGVETLRDCSLKTFLREDEGKSAETQSSWQFHFGDGPAESRHSHVRPNDEYSSQRGYGFLKTDSDKAAVFAIDIEEGNYAVTMRFGHADRSTSTTIKAEARRLMLENVETAPGEFVTRTFSVNVRGPMISSGNKVALNSRELENNGHPNWDGRLTLEFNGKQPRVDAVTIEPATDTTTIFIAGDSTVTDQRNEPYAGWGQMLTRFFKPSVTVSNYAESGLALRSFEYQRRLEKVLSTMKAGDYLLIQFGHNDQKDRRKDAGAFTTYKRKLAEFVEAVRSKQGIPVLITSMERLRMDERGNQTPTLFEFAEAVRQVGMEKDVPVIDLNAMSLEFYAALGPKRATEAFVFYPARTFPGQVEALEDRTHHNSYGAYELARCVVEGIRAQVPELAGHLANDVGSFDLSHPDDPKSFHLSPSPMVQVSKKPVGN
ncbi:oligogalacturonate lyase family protein [Rubripirellula reticaptiva]|uniref:Rhamnogalacturonan acetylesterase RhgT n=1 Tax=Rubripirellula reticaptiva TaxID=2528013 RepID=A0A5C6ETK2_9BACT|nr:oligogalacturonate lyase family protein [Rubripirellula reticaptiva]TWU51714.1 Rhamnogalacturonan acetylesterase RhgT [Rubripirellula reticaptiva]